MSGKGGKGSRKVKYTVYKDSIEDIKKPKILRSALKGTFLEPLENKIPESVKEYVKAAAFDAVKITDEIIASQVCDKILSVKDVGKGSNDLRETIRKLIALKKAFRTGKIFKHAHDFDYNMSGNWGKECHEALMMALDSSTTLFNQHIALLNFSRIINMEVFETMSQEDKIKIQNHLCCATNFEDFFKKLNSIKSTTGVGTTGKMWMELFNVGFGICEYANVGPIIEAAKAHIELKSGGLPVGGIIVSAGIIQIIGPIYPGVEIYANRVLNSDGYAVISNEVTSAHKDSIFDGLGVSIAFGDSTTDFFRSISINFGSPKPGNNFPLNSDFHFTDNTNYPASEVIRILEEYFSS